MSFKYLSATHILDYLQQTSKHVRNVSSHPEHVSGMSASFSFSETAMCIPISVSRHYSNPAPAEEQVSASSFSVGVQYSICNGKNLITINHCSYGVLNEGWGCSTGASGGFTHSNVESTPPLSCQKHMLIHTFWSDKSSRFVFIIFLLVL